MRIDLYLSQNGFAESRQKAKLLLESSLVTVNGKTVTKSSHNVEDGDVVLVTGTALRYVGRGGLKLEGALEAFAFDPSGMTAVDIGASTGGFTDCLLQHGAEKVYAVDAGTDQLHTSLRTNPKVICLENCNAKTLGAHLIAEKVPLAVMDLSFISQTAIYPALTNVLADGGHLISLIKPQFEAGKRALNKNGIVKDKKIHEAVLIDVIEKARGFGLYCKDIAVSSITGGDGNVEYLAIFIYKRTMDPMSRDKIKRTVFGEKK